MFGKARKTKTTKKKKQVKLGGKLSSWG